MPIVLTETSNIEGAGGVDADAGSNVDSASFESVDNLHNKNLAEAAFHHKAASKYKNRFASHLHAIVEVESIVFSLPDAIGGYEVMLPHTIAISVCLFVGAFGASCPHNIQIPLHYRKTRGPRITWYVSLYR